MTEKLHQFFSLFIILFFLSLSFLRCNVQIALLFYFCTVQVFLRIQVFVADPATLTGFRGRLHEVGWLGLPGSRHVCETH